MSAHTPGPWTWFDYPDGRKLLAAASRAVIHCPDAPMTCDPEDARLIAAAPELLAALRAIFIRMREREVVGLSVEEYVAAESAIAKAEGA